MIWNPCKIYLIIDVHSPEFRSSVMESDWVSKAKLQPTAEAALWSLLGEDSAIYFL